MVDCYADNPSSFKHLLCYNLANIPKDQLSRAEHLPNVLQPVLFNLAVLHTAVSLIPSQGDDLAPVHYSYFMTTVNKLLSKAELTSHRTPSEDSVGETLHHLSTLVSDVYSGCAPRDRLLTLVQELLSVKSCSSDAHIRPLPNVELTTPTSAISSDRFTKHVANTSFVKTSEHGESSQPRR